MKREKRLNEMCGNESGKSEMAEKKIEKVTEMS